MSVRNYELKPAVRERVPAIVTLTGPSGGGKTMSALRLATGMQRVVGGKIACIDTESRRALHYAEAFKFDHLDFKAPFSPLDYLEAIEHCKSRGASIIIIDSISHEHDGPGGVLEWHDAEVERLCKLWGVKPGKAQIPAWSEPKKARRKLIQTVLHLGINLVLCMRAAEKIGLKGDKVIDMGWTQIGGRDFIFESTLSCLLLPGSGGVPTWNPERPGERAMTKIPEYLKSIFAQRQPLSEDIGEKLARWAEGDVAGKSIAGSVAPAAVWTGDDPVTRLEAELKAATSLPGLDEVSVRVKGGQFDDMERTRLKEAYIARWRELKVAAFQATQAPEPALQEGGL